MELIFNLCGEFWKSGGPSQPNHSPCWCPWDHFRSFKVCSDAKERVRCGKQWEATAPIESLVKLQPWFLSFWLKTCLQQNCSLGSCTCSEGPDLVQNVLMDDDDDDNDDEPHKLMKLLGTINVVLVLTNRLVIKYFDFGIYWRTNRSIIA